MTILNYLPVSNNTMNVNLRDNKIKTFQTQIVTYVCMAQY